MYVPADATYTRAPPFSAAVTARSTSIPAASPLTKKSPRYRPGRSRARVPDRAPAPCRRRSCRGCGSRVPPHSSPCGLPRQLRSSLMPPSRDDVDGGVGQRRHHGGNVFGIAAFEVLEHQAAVGIEDDPRRPSVGQRLSVHEDLLTGGREPCGPWPHQPWARILRRKRRPPPALKADRPVDQAAWWSRRMRCNLRIFGQEPLEEEDRPRLDLRKATSRAPERGIFWGSCVSVLGSKGVLAIFGNYM